LLSVCFTNFFVCLFQLCFVFDLTFTLILILNTVSAIISVTRHFSVVKET